MKELDGHKNHTSGGNNYLLKSDAKGSNGLEGWIAFQESIIHKLKTLHGNTFFLMPWSETRGGYYRIPFSAVEHFFTEGNKTHGKDGDRWQFNRRVEEDERHTLIFNGNSNEIVEITEYFKECKDFQKKPEAVTEDKTEADIQEALRIVKQRRSQSSFRKKVLNNYSSKCCITNIQEEELLEAGHIVPYSELFNGTTKHKLDVANGLCFYTEVHVLFDLGYFSFDDNLRIIVARNDGLSPGLQKRLNSLSATTASLKKTGKVLDYIKWHREHVFRG